MLKFILEYCGQKPAALDTYRGNLSFERFTESYLAQNRTCGLIEVPMQALRQKQVSGRMFQAAALTNLSVDHLTDNPSPESYFAVKSRLFTDLPKGAKAIVNADDSQALLLAQDGRLDFLTFAIDYPQAMIVAENLVRHRYTSTFDLVIKTEFADFANHVVTPRRTKISLPVPGGQNIYNALLAASLALLLQVDLQKIAEALGNFPGIRRNMEIIIADHYVVIDDAARNAEGIRYALAAAEIATSGHVLVLHGIYGGGGPAVNRCNARALAAWFHTSPQSRLFVTRSMYHCKSKYQVLLSEEKAFLAELKENGVDFAYYPDLPDAVDTVLSHAADNDLVLFLGSHTLDRAGMMALQTLGEQKDSDALYPSGMQVITPHPHAQILTGNPT
jgi:UDP-N-acetylmuramoyl-L-alanyl-D-glutamate--2,6-diaminopimelate ligase